MRDARTIPALPEYAWRRFDLTALGGASARYQFATVETLAWLREKMSPYQADDCLEICSGCGDFCFHLGIRGTDSAIQTRPDVAACYYALGIPPTEPPSFVERLEAEEAVRKYRPRCVLGCWVTELAEGSPFGVDEEAIFSMGIERYILLGHVAHHGKKRIFSFPHEEYSFPWLLSRALDPSGNRAWVWDIRKKGE